MRPSLGQFLAAIRGEVPDTTIRGRAATRLDELEAGIEPAFTSTCSSCGAPVLEPPPPAGALAGLTLPPVCRPCIRAAVRRGDTVMAAQPLADRRS